MLEVILQVKNIAKIISLTMLFDLFQYKLPIKYHIISAIRAEIKTNSNVAGNLSDINSDTGLLN